jgi:hypothetical protein
MSRVWFRWIAAGLAILASGCEGPRKYRSESGSPGQVDSVVRERAEKDAFFRAGGGSPIPASERATFRGLSYFDVDPAFRFRLMLNRYPAPQPLRIGTNTGEMRGAIRYGFFEFDVDGKACRLQVYRLDEGESGGPRLFIPFRDLTTGKETYGAGRYMELKENTTGTYDLDFNRAFNPYCAYNETFSCPIPPAENSLPIAIRAGEKKYLLARDHPAG